MEIGNHYVAVAAKMTGELLRGLCSLPDPEHAVSALTTVLSNVTGNINDAGWAASLEAAKVPCGTEWCDCEKRRTALFVALDLLREDHKSKCAQKKFHPQPGLN